MDRVRAVLRHRALYEIGAEIQPDNPVGRKPAHPAYLLLIYASLARVLRSGIRVETDLLEGELWDLVRHESRATLRREGLDLPPPGRRPPAWHHWRRLRDDHLATDEDIAMLQRLHLPRAVGLAQRIGMLNPRGPGSMTHPSHLRAVYGDGTIVRPIYAPPKKVLVEDDHGETVVQFIDPHTGELVDRPGRRYDPDVALHQGHAGPALGHGYVAWHTRGTGIYQRVMLHLGYIDHPGGEAGAAVDLLRDIHRVAGNGIEVAIFDGAFRGTHIDEIMTRYGYQVIAKQPTYTDEDLATAAIVKGPDGRRVPSIPLGIATHNIEIGVCRHTLAAINGAVAEIDLDDSGDPVVRSTPQRTAVKRARRADGRFHFNVGYRIDCARAPFETWLSPHAKNPGDPRPEALRVFPDGDPDTLRLRGLRSDAESVHSGFKRTLITERAMSLGWRRGLIDYYAFAWYTNALAEAAWRAAQVPDNIRQLRRRT
jgi:hypothetical protein